MRKTILDTETTGLHPEHGHKIIEIAAIEMIDNELTGKEFHYYLDPQRPIDPGAAKIHGITDDMVKGKPVFKDINEELKEFVSGSQCIIHNAQFDTGFLDKECEIIEADWRIAKIADILCTLWASWNHDGVRYKKGYNLDSLSKKYDVKIERVNHGALLDANILAQVYLGLLKDGVVK